MKNIRKRKQAETGTILSVIIVSLMLSGCGSYQSPYDRGYGEGYEKGYEDASAGAEKDPTVQEESKKTSGIKRDNGETQESEAPEETSDTAPGQVGDESAGDEAGSSDAASEQTPEGEAPDTAEGEGGEASASDGAESSEGAEGSEGEVLGEMAGEESSGEAETAPDSSRVITAAAVNEALYSNPEVINGLLNIYEPQYIFGDFVGDSGTNTLHKVGGSYFNSLTYDRIVVFDSSKSVQDVLDEGFYTLSDDMQ